MVNSQNEKSQYCVNEDIDICSNEVEDIKMGNNINYENEDNKQYIDTALDTFYKNR